MRARGFTLIELVITVAIVGLLATAAFPLAEMAARRTKEQELRLALREIRDALDAYKTAFDAGHIEQEVGQTGYPPDLESLAAGVEDVKDPEAGLIYFMRRVPRDPLFPDATASASKSWGLRSYESPPDDPQPGVDVFDVYSLSPGTGLNGVKYRDW
ncbi:MAG: type II secretion system GspH family protein [Gammaproteobacteria bacterium]|nr:type II secretion system GspH family protein [Gammaproteobacteria bacterium]